MKVVSRYCDSCGVKIPSTDIEERVALKVEDSYYCRDCKDEVLPLLEKKDGGGSANGRAPAKAGPPRTASPKVGAKPAPSKPAPGAKAAAGAAARKPLAGRPAPGRPGPGVRPPLKKAPRPPSDEDDEVDSDEDLEPRRAPKKSRTPLFAAAGVGAAVLASFLWFALGGGGGGGASDAPVAKKEEPKKSAVQIQREKDAKHWADAVEAVKDKPVGTRLKALDEARYAIQDAEVMDRANAAVDELEAELKAEGRRVFEELSNQARELAEVGSIEAAIATLRGFPEELRGSPWYRNVQGEIPRYEKLLAAKNEAEPLERKARELAEAKEFYRAVGVLEGFDASAYSGSPWVSRLEGLRRQFDELATSAEQDAALSEMERKEKEARERELAAKREKKRKDFEKAMASDRWERIPTDSLFGWNKPDPMPKDGCWKVEEVNAPGSPSPKGLVGRSGAALETMSGGMAAVVGYGDPSWKDYIVEIRYRIAKGSFKLGVRATKDGKWVELDVETIADGQWHSMQVQVYGDESDAFQQVVDGAPKAIKFDAHHSEAGGVAFALAPNSECAFADVKVKVINKS